MKKTLIGLAALGLTFGLNYQAITSSFQPPAAHTGAPGEQTCATSGCHTGNLNTGTGSVVLVNPPAAYVPGQTYALQLQVNTAGQARAGFEFVALNSQNQQAGTLTITNTNNTALQTQGGKQYISHKNAATNNTWSFNWTAPATNVGTVRFYFAGNAANGNSNTTGDFIYTSSLSLNPGTGTGIKEAATAQVNVFPNPASNRLNLNLARPATRLKVLDLAGRELHALENVALESQLDVSAYPNGTYFLQLEQDQTQQLKRFVVQH